MLTTPIMRMPIRPFDAREEYRFQFEIEGGAQVLKSKLIIKNQVTDAEIYNKTQTSFAYRHTIPPNTLTNGETYLVKVQTGGLSVNAETGAQQEIWSQFSEEEIVFPLSPARITIPTTIIDTDNQNRVNNEEIEFQADYEQDEGERLQNFRFILYDDSKQIIKVFPEQFYTGTGPLVQFISGLKHRELYYLEIKGETVKGMPANMDLVWFRPFYEVPELKAVIEAENLKDKGAIKLSSSIVQIIGELYDNEGNIVPFDEIDFIDNEMVDLTREDYGKVVFKQGFKIRGSRFDSVDESDFVLKLKCKNLISDEPFLILEGDKGNIEIKKVAYEGPKDELIGLDRILVEKNSIGSEHIAQFITKPFTFKQDQMYGLQMRQIKNVIDIQINEMEVAEDDNGL